MSCEPHPTPSSARCVRPCCCYCYVCAAQYARRKRVGTRPARRIGNSNVTATASGRGGAGRDEGDGFFFNTLSLSGHGTARTRRNETAGGVIAVNIFTGLPLGRFIFYFIFRTSLPSSAHPRPSADEGSGRKCRFARRRRSTRACSYFFFTPCVYYSDARGNVCTQLAK